VVSRLMYPVLVPPGWTPGSFAGYTFRESGLEQLQNRCAPEPGRVPGKPLAFADATSWGMPFAKLV
jgi:hypothetical protein